MPLYETTFITRPDMSRQDVDKLTQFFTGLLEQNGGKIVKNEYWGLRNLAYVIHKHRKGHYVFLASESPAAALKEMERNMRISEDVIRLMSVRVETISEAPSAIMNFRNYRDEGSEGTADVESSAA